MKEFFKMLGVKFIYLFKKFVFNKEMFEKSMEELREETIGLLGPVIESKANDLTEDAVLESVFETIAKKVKYFPPLVTAVEAVKGAVDDKLNSMKTYASANVDKKITMVFDKMTAYVVAALGDEEA